MNPFDFYGPQFLVFFVFLSLVVFAVTSFIRRIVERNIGVTIAPQIQAIAADPYQIAYLRGGKNEAARVAALSLIDRGLLVATNDQLQTAEGVHEDHARRNVERAILRMYSGSAPATSLYASLELEGVFEHEYDPELQRMRLLPDETIQAARSRVLMFAAIFLAGVAVIKILVALVRGRTNVALLIVFTVIAIVILNRVAKPRQTIMGKELLEDVQRLFVGLKDRAASIRPGGATNELALLAAVFGMGAVPSSTFPWKKQLFPKADASSSSSGSSCGSSCGSSGCGGGGGCGGGCGGCGG